MKRILSAILAMLAASAFVYGVATVRAQEAAPPRSIAVEITGVNMGLTAAFAKEQAAAVPAPFGELNGLKAASIKDIAAASEISELKDKMVYYVPVQAALPLLAGAGAQGKPVKIIGKLFKDERALVVESFEMQGGENWDSLPVGNHSQVQVL